MSEGAGPPPPGIEGALLVADELEGLELRGRIAAGLAAQALALTEADWWPSALREAADELEGSDPHSAQGLRALARLLDGVEGEGER